jgi:hypothetical protein
VERTSLVAIYRQGRESSGKPSDVFAIRAVVPLEDMSIKSANLNRWDYLQPYETVAEISESKVMRHQRRHMNMSALGGESE